MNKMFLALGIAGVLICSVPTMPVKAVSNVSTQTTSADNQIRTAGLITLYNLSVSASGSTLYVSGITQGRDSMKSIGYTNISVEYSSDDVNWHTEKSIDDLLISDSSSYYLNNYPISVKGGYYYRIKLKHYAKEKGLFGRSQSVENTSNSVWVN